MSDKKINNKERLIRALLETENKAKDLSSKAVELNKKARFVADVAFIQRKFIDLIPDDSFFPENTWSDNISSWAKLSGNITNVDSALNNTIPLDFATGTSSMSTLATISVSNIAKLPQEQQHTAHTLFLKNLNLFEQSSWAQSIVDNLIRLGLSSNYPNKASVQSLIEQSEAALSSPSIQEVSPQAVLIPLREAINRALSLLLQKRPQQEMAKKQGDKVRSILNQCSHNFVDSQAIDKLANEANILNDLLSSAKQAKMGRDKVRELLQKGLLFLNLFLKAVDETKIR